MLGELQSTFLEKITSASVPPMRAEVFASVSGMAWESWDHDGALAHALYGASAEHWIKGRLFPSEESLLAEELARFQRKPGALVGSIDFDGRYCFGYYPLVYQVALDAPLSLPTHEKGCVGGPQGEINIEPSSVEYAEMVGHALEHIAAGNIYQVNLARRFSVGWQGSAVSLYEQLRTVSPAPFAAWLRQPEREICSASPESFLDVRGGRITTCPIKGTRQRGATPCEDAQLRSELLASTKERAELLMITDLLRNDIGRVCTFGSVDVPHLIALRTFPMVHHLLSVVTGRLRAEVGLHDILQATFPGGSITGAPKIRAIEVIKECEALPRGLFTGALGVIFGDGTAFFNIAIRTAVVEAGTATYFAGAGIVADSDPTAEGEETSIKARPFIQAVERCRNPAGG